MQEIPTPMEWTDDLSVGVESMDAEHRSMLSLVNELADAVAKRTDEAEIARLFHELSTATEEHFAHEEKILRATNYPDLEWHMHEHELIARTISAIEEHYKRGGLQALSSPMMNLIEFTFTNHILRTDKHYSSHLIHNGAD